MRKMRKFLPSFLILLFVFAACSNGAYKTAMEEGKAAVQAEDYEGALGHFKEAQTEAPNNKAANAAIEQTELTILAEKAAAEDD